MNADTQRKWDAIILFYFLDRRQHIHRQKGHGLGMTRFRLWQTADHHVGVPNGLDLLQAVLFGEFVKSEKYLIEFGYQSIRRYHARILCEIDDISEQNTDVVVLFRNGALACLQNPSRFSRQYVQQQLVGFFPFPDGAGHEMASKDEDDK